jgi:hypothetical protein
MGSHPQSTTLERDVTDAAPQPHIGRAPHRFVRFRRHSHIRLEAGQTSVVRKAGCSNRLEGTGEPAQGALLSSTAGSCAMTKLSRRGTRIFRPFRISRTWQALGWVATGVMAVVTLGYLASAI